MPEWLVDGEAAPRVIRGGRVPDAIGKSRRWTLDGEGHASGSELEHVLGVDAAEFESIQVPGQLEGLFVTFADVLDDALLYTLTASP